MFFGNMFYASIYMSYQIRGLSDTHLLRLKDALPASIQHVKFVFSKTALGPELRTS